MMDDGWGIQNHWQRTRIRTAGGSFTAVELQLKIPAAFQPLFRQPSWPPPSLVSLLVVRNASRLLHRYNSNIDAPTGLHVSSRRSALSALNMPAMSPTMTEGGIAEWKKKEGDKFTAGDVLLEIVCLSLNVHQIVRFLTLSSRLCRKPTRRQSTWKLRMTAC